ncbi:MAG TPA: hypothetical protein VGL94_06010 [Ktedonobacteraceae bacterium]|jgi:hypothetical protein
MRPKLKADTFYTPVPDGVYFRNNQTSFRIKGKVIYRWVERLAPYLNSQHTLEEITEELDSERQAMVTDLVETLTTNHFLKDSSTLYFSPTRSVGEFVCTGQSVREQLVLLQ